jgi:hypothetical protein
MAVSDYFAELYVAGKFADEGWNVYFPHRDKGFDFIVSKQDSGAVQILMPVQVKGKYPTSTAMLVASPRFIPRWSWLYHSFWQIHPMHRSVLHTCHFRRFGGIPRLSL